MSDVRQESEMSVEGCGALPGKTEEIGRSSKKHLGHDISQDSPRMSFAAG